MSRVQEQFNSDRENIRKGLFNPVKCNSDTISYKDLKPIHRAIGISDSTPEIIKRSSRVQMKSPSLLRSNFSRSVGKRAEHINSLIKSCDDVKQASQRLIKHFPAIEKTWNESYKNIKKIVKRLEESTSLEVLERIKTKDLISKLTHKKH